MKTLNISLLSCAVLAFTLLGASAQVEAGKAAPAFSLPGADGKTHALSDFKGKYVVLEWTNHECPFVKKFYSGGAMQALQKQTVAKGVVWLQVVSSAPGKQGFVTAAQALELNKAQGAAATATLLDPDGKVGKLYGAQTTPHMYVISPEGTLIYMGAIDDKPSTKPEDIAGAKNYVTAALDEALAGKPVTTPVTKSYGCSVKY